MAGVVRQAAQHANVRSYRALDTDGVTDEWYLGHQLALVLTGGARVINLSLGTTTRTDQSLMGLTALEAAARGQRRRRRAPIVVAAAGNLGDSRKVYPAADDWTISVGAVELTGTGKKAPESGHLQQFWRLGRRVRRRSRRPSSFEAKRLPGLLGSKQGPAIRRGSGLERDLICRRPRQRQSGRGPPEERSSSIGSTCSKN